VAAARTEVERIREGVRKAVSRNLGDCMLLSAGLDTSIIAFLAREHREFTCYTVHFTLGESPDVAYARSLTKRLGLPWRLIDLEGGASLEETLEDVVESLGTFDPMEVRNSAAVHRGMKELAKAGFKEVMTGDAADELFAGYSFIYNLPPQKMMEALHHMWDVMQFSSIPLAESLGMKAKIPFLDRGVVDLAKRLGPKSLVGVRNGTKYGKYLLRVAFEDTIGAKAAWRVKTPIELGSGTTSLTEYFSGKVKDSDFTRKKEEIRNDGVNIRDKEQLVYYEMYARKFPPPGESAHSFLRCPECGADVTVGAEFCTRCGAYPIKGIRAK
jgi:asparagine synthase (glutamine-hydrolysing)